MVAACTGDTATSYSLLPGPASRLTFVTQPSSALPGATMTPPIVVAIQDASHRNVDTAAAVTVAIGGDPGGATLAGTTTVIAVNGLAVFPDLSIEAPGTYTLEASSGPLTGATSALFQIGAGPVLRVTTATAGTDLPSGYSLCVDPDFYYYGGCLTYDAAIGTNATVTVPVLPGTHSVSLNGVPSNCTVSGDTFRTVTVSDTTDVIFAVGCVFAEKIALVSSGTISIAWVDGSAVRPLTTGSAPAWAPDGSRLAYECGPNLCAINADSTGFAQITMDGAGYHHPTWSPDGLHLAFASTRDGPAELYAMAANGSGVVRLTQNVGFVGSPAWSPDGSRIVFDCAVDAGNDDLCMINADGTGFTRLTSDPARDYGAAWKPDGSTLAFATTRYGEDEVVLLSPVGGSVTRIGSGLPGFEPTWAPDGTQLALVQVRQVCDQYGCGMYNLVEVHHADGSDTPVKAGDQPAWRPHP